MTENIKKRVMNIANYIYSTKSTVRTTAKVFNISKSTVHNDVHIRLKKIDGNLFKEISKIMQSNFDQKHIRGGLATQKKFQLRHYEDK